MRESSVTLTAIAVGCVLVAACLLLWPGARAAAGPVLGTHARGAAGRVGAHAGASSRSPAAPRRWSAADRSARWRTALVTGLTGTRTGRLVLSGSVGCLTLLVVGGAVGVVAAALTGVAVLLWLSRSSPAPAPRWQSAAGRDLPLAFNLFAACLRAGRPPDSAATTVGSALGGPVGEHLLVVARGLQLGLPPEEAWSSLAAFGLAGPAVRALGRCADSGAALASALTRQAEDLRAQQAVAARAAVQRVAVLVVLPLGLCFLPAFICIGVVPVVAGVLARVLP